MTNNLLAVPIITNIGEVRLSDPQINKVSKIYSGYGHGKIHDQSPNYNTDNYYEVKFGAPPIPHIYLPDFK